MDCSPVELTASIGPIAVADQDVRFALTHAFHKRCIILCTILLPDHWTENQSPDEPMQVFDRTFISCERYQLWDLVSP